MRIQGKIVSWNHKKGFGFVKPLNGHKEVFIHIKEFNWKPEIGQTISFIHAKDIKGRDCGKAAMLCGEFLPYEKSSSGSIFNTAIALISLVAISLYSLIQISNYWIPIGYLVISLLTFIVYWIDKSAAQSGSWRTSENTLHLLALIGGWPGAMVAQQKLRHKTQKQPFRSIFWITVIANLGGLYWLSTQTQFAFI
ncbi:DUF1294 domain-containing protein [Thiomicrorhabdus sp.]|uniref:DUF1294 domain-containing protein n=1 Tax=Thiomicrorhabdus sp. TaxID=2039724 RepID=UPI002AA8FF83|nr:DUF1294 domain-containing protein [Thiomicrorhabdus sp.]